MKRYIYIIGLLMGLCLSAAAQEKKGISGWSGGMMVHTGYISGCDNPYGYNPQGATLGMGGVAKVHLSDHFRVGIEGYFSNIGLKKDICKGSFNKVFWTGALCDWYWKCGKFVPYIGASFGGGMETALYMFEGDRNDWLPETSVVYYKQPFFAFDPFVGVEYALNDTVHLITKADYLFGIRSENKALSLNQPSGPRLYFGVVFTH